MSTHTSCVCGFRVVRTINLNCPSTRASCPLAMDVASAFASWSALHYIMTYADDVASAMSAALDLPLMTCVVSLWSELLPIHDISPHVCGKLGYQQQLCHTDKHLKTQFVRGSPCAA